MTINYVQNFSDTTNGYIVTPTDLSSDTWLIGYVDGRNIVLGGSGNDIVEVNGGGNLLTGGLGRDVFEFFTNPVGYQIITDFSSSDIIVFTNVGFISSSSAAITLLQYVSGFPIYGEIEVSSPTAMDFSSTDSNAINTQTAIHGLFLAVGGYSGTSYIYIKTPDQNTASEMEASLRVTNNGSYVDPADRIQNHFLYSYSGTTAIAGSAIGGNQLTAVITDNTFLTNAPSSGITYRWYADSVLVSTSSLDNRYFTLPLSLLGKQITVSASYIDGYGNAETSALSTASSAVNGILAFAYEVSDNLDYVQANHIALSGSNVTFNIFDSTEFAVNATVAQLTSCDDALNLIRTKGNLIGVADTASNISAGIPTLLANASILSDLSITDDGIVQLSPSLVSSLLSLAGSYGVDLTSHTFDDSILVNKANDGTLYIKAGGILSVCVDGGLAFFNGAFSNTDGIYANASSIVPLLASSGGIGGFTLPDLFTGPSSLGLTYQLIETAENAVVTGSIFNEFIKVANSNSIGKAVNGNGGNDVIDGGVGSTFVTGGDNHNTTFFLDGRAPGTSWSTITDFQAGIDKATIWGFVKGVSSIDTSFTNYNNDGAAGYTGLTLHFKNLLPDGQTSGSNANLNSITFTGYSLEDFGVNSLAELNTQINNGTNAHILVGATQDSLGTHSYLYFY